MLLPKHVDNTSDKTAIIRSLTNLIIVAIILIAFGLVMLHSASYIKDGVTFFKKQLVWIFIGLTGGAAAFTIGYRKMANLSLIWLAISWCALLLCLCFQPINGAYRWIKVGSFSIQPSEFAKVAVALFTAKYCSDHAYSFSKFKDKNGIIKISIILGITILAVFAGKDLGTTVLIAATALLTLFAAGLYFRYFLAMLISGFSLASIYVVFFSLERLSRITSFLDPESSSQDSGYQLWNSLLALGSGNWFGVGFMKSRMKARYLPEAHTDFILSIIGEELGFIAITSIIVLYAIFCWNAIKISLKARSRLGTLLGFALTCGIILQAAINLLVVSGSAPTKGMPAPFISYGGSNMIACLIAVGLLLSIASEAYDAENDERIRKSIINKLFFFTKLRKKR